MLYNRGRVAARTDSGHCRTAADLRTRGDNWPLRTRGASAPLRACGDRQVWLQVSTAFHGRTNTIIYLIIVMWNQNQVKHCEIKVNKSAAVSMSAKILFLRVRTWAILSQNLRLGKRKFNKVGIAAIATTTIRFASELCSAQTPPSPFWCLWLRPQKLRSLLLQISRCTASGCWSWGIHQQEFRTNHSILHWPVGLKS